MIEHDDDFSPPPRRSWFRKLRNVAFWCLGLLAVGMLLAFVGRFQVNRIGQRQLEVATARLNAEEPGWGIDAIFAERKKNAPTENENAAPDVAKLAAQIPKEYRDWQISEEGKKFWLPHAANKLPPANAIEAARKVAPCTQALRNEALLLRDKCGGYTPIALAANPFSTLIPHVQNAREIASLLQYDGYLAALNEQPNSGITAARAALGGARSIGDEPFLISQLVRIACAKVAAQTAMQVLAWSYPTEGLAELQTELLAEANVPWFQIGVRGERAMLDKTFAGLMDGTIKSEELFGSVGRPAFMESVAFRAYKGFLPGDRAKALELMTKYLEASKLPHHEQLAALNLIQIPPGPPDDFRYLLSRLMLPAHDRVAEAGLRARADLLAAATCIACERYRLKHGDWPRNLTQLTPAYLPAVPLNPFHGKPLEYRMILNGIAVVCPVANVRVNLEGPDELRDPDTNAIGIGYRMWRPRYRGLPAVEQREP